LTEGENITLPYEQGHDRVLAVPHAYTLAV
jgi:hypothetical protein